LACAALRVLSKKKPPLGWLSGGSSEIIRATPMPGGTVPTPEMDTMEYRA
jgi:hypothetical protein